VRRGSRWGRGALLAATALLLTRGARAQDTCATAYEAAQERRRGHELSRSRAELRLCERACPTKLAEDCSGWRREVEAELGSVVLDVRDAAGQAAPGVRVTLDGAPLVSGVAGEPVEMDPGKHTLLFDDASGRHAEAEVTLAPGEKGRAVSVRVSLRPLPAPLLAPARPPPAVTHSPAAYVLGIAGLLGLSAGAVLGIKGQVERAGLAQSCSPRCDRATQVDPIAAEWWGGAIAATAGAALLGIGGAVWIAEGRTGGSAALVSVVPGPGWVGVVGRF